MRDMRPEWQKKVDTVETITVYDEQTGNKAPVGTPEHLVRRKGDMRSMTDVKRQAVME